MRIVVLISKLHAGSELALNKLLKEKKVNVVGIVRSDISMLKRKYWRYVTYGVRRAGLFYGALIALTAYLPLVGMLLASILIWNRRGKWLSVEKLIELHSLKVHDTEDINSRESVKVLKKWKPDVLVSLSFDQILKKQVIQVPKVAALNVHPGLLPKYRGLWPEFWKLHNREKFAGVTIHHLIEQIDAGDILAQSKYPIKKADTKFSLALRSAHHGTKLLIDLLGKMKQGIRLKPLKLKGKPVYYSFPRKTHFDSFYSRGKRLFSVPEIWKAFERRY
jgi:folate-dependent phosphoribosylglycinamide formyltransferase PurN